MPYVRFPIPAFDYVQFKDREWSPPVLLSKSDATRLISAHGAGDESVYGCYPIMPPGSFFDRFALRGEHRHALLCLLPPRGVRMVGRSHAWFINRALIVDSADAATPTVVADWKTPRPMNTRLGPDDGIEVGGALCLVCSHSYADHWIVNRTLTDNDWVGNDGYAGCRILSCSDDEANDFHHANITFEWHV
jgi:hypothetical protein